MANGSDYEPDPWGPTGSQSRASRTSAGQRLWPLRGDASPESAENARSEYARGMEEKGTPLGRDIQLPAQKRTVRKPRQSTSDRNTSR